MCKKLLDNVMCVTRKNCKIHSCKSKIEGVMLGVLIGVAGGVALGMFANTEKGKQLRNKMLCNCMSCDCNFDDE